MTISKEIFNYVLDNTSVDECSGCWEYQGNLSKAGYGILNLNGQKYRTHRVVYQFLYRKVNLPYMLCHICNNPKCCNPYHLYEGTAKDNKRDQVLCGTSSFSNTPQHSEHGHSSRLTKQQVVEARKMAAEGYDHNDIALELKVVRRTLSKAITGQSWRSVDNIHPPVLYNKTKGSSSYKGVKISNKHKKTVRYVARVGYKGSRFYIGAFLDEKEAAKMYDYCYQCIRETGVAPNGTKEEDLIEIQKDSKLNRRLREFVIKVDNSDYKK